MKKMEGLDVEQFLRKEKNPRKGFNNIWLVDRQGCPACGNRTTYELKPPNFPQVHVCEHVRGLDRRNEGDGIYLVKYHYLIEVIKRPRKHRDNILGNIQAIPGRIRKKQKPIQKSLFDFDKIEVKK